MGIIFFTRFKSNTSRCQVQTFTIWITTRSAWQEVSSLAESHTPLCAHSILSSAECRLCQVSTRESVMDSEPSTPLKDSEDSPSVGPQPWWDTLAKDSVSSDSTRSSRMSTETLWEPQRR